MDVLIEHDGISSGELQRINCVRQHLKLLTLSDIADIRGKRILREIKQGIVVRPSSFTFRHQDPPKSWMKLWQYKACPILEKKLSKTPLRGWIKNTHQTWQWNLSSCRKYIKHNTSTYFKKVENNCFRKCEEPEGKPLFTSIVDVTIGKNKNPYIIAHMQKLKRIRK